MIMIKQYRIKTNGKRYAIQYRYKYIPLLWFYVKAQSGMGQSNARIFREKLTLANISQARNEIAELQKDDRYGRKWVTVEEID